MRETKINSFDCEKSYRVVVYYQNVRGLRTKLFHLNAGITASQADILLLSETWLAPGITDADIIPSGYQILRVDRQGPQRGGGVGVAIIAPTRYILQPVQMCNVPVGCKFVRANISKQNNIVLLTVGCLYIPPRMNDEVYLSIFNIIETVCSKYKNVLICGDFNLNINSNSVTVRVNLEYLMSFCGIQQVNNVFNNHGSMLDLALASTLLGRVKVQRALDIIILPDEYHPQLEIELIERKVPNSVTAGVDTSMEWDFRNANFLALYDSFLNANWNSILHIDDPHKAVTELYYILNSCIDSCVPIKRREIVLSRYSYPDWYTPLTKRYIKLKAYFHRLY